jgi:cyclohexyl-isocyanide hydratase
VAISATESDERLFLAPDARTIAVTDAATPMRVAFCAFEGMTALDFVGAYDPVTRLDRMDLADLSWDVCARTADVSTNGLRLGVDRVAPDLGEYDLLFVPGGTATRTLRCDESFVAWLRTAADCDYLTSVCTGSLLLGAAGFLDGKRATTHPSARALLAEDAEVVEARVVRDGDVVTGAGVSSALDLGLALVELLADESARDAVAAQMDYPHRADVRAVE